MSLIGKYYSRTRPYLISGEAKRRESTGHDIRDTRGFLTHPSEKKSKHIVSGNELENLIRKLKIILEICLLKSLGLDSSKFKAWTRSRYLL